MQNAFLKTLPQIFFQSLEKFSISWNFFQRKFVAKCSSGHAKWFFENFARNFFLESRNCSFKVWKKIQICKVSSKKCFVQNVLLDRWNAVLTILPNIFSSKSDFFSWLSGKIFLLLPKSFLKMFLWTCRNESWEHYFLLYIVLTVLSAGLLAPWGTYIFSWNFQPFDFRATSYPPSTENIRELMCLLFLLLASLQWVYYYFSQHM